MYQDYRDKQVEKFARAVERMRSLRKADDERKKESQIKITDRLPPAKRTKCWFDSDLSDARN